MKISCITIARDEASILPSFADQVIALFDDWILLDHSSVDSGVSKVRTRCGDRVEILRLLSNGYPQSEVTTLLARRAFEEGGADVVVALDCDEFLPFADRAAFETFLEGHRKDGVEAVLMPWLNVVPENLDGSNIFHGPFFHGVPSERYSKVVMFRGLFERVPGFRVWQGNHGIDCGTAAPAKIVETPDNVLLHIPVRSVAQLALKLANGSGVILNDPGLRKRGYGSHWVELALDCRTRGASLDWVQRLALGYPGVAEVEVLRDALPLKFDFPYVQTPYAEDSSDTAAIILRPLAAQPSNAGTGEAQAPWAFTILAESGDVVFESKSVSGPNRPAAGRAAPLLILGRETLGEHYADLVEPLFSLPVKLLPSAWTGHIPFLSVLFRMLQPANYVELGVHLGASLTAAASAAASYRLAMKIYGVDTWQGDEHAGFYDGNGIYEDLRSFMAERFPNVTLIRSLFAEARQSFQPGSIDVLHIDGLHSYDAVKEDFVTWLPAMSENGVVLFHDICVLDRGFGVHRLWAELKRHYATLEFHHSFGLGVLFLNPELPALSPLIQLGADETAAALYRSLAADIAATLPDRMAAAQAENAVQAAQARALDEMAAKVAAVYASTSWRITAPLRALKRR